MARPLTGAPDLLGAEAPPLGLVTEDLERVGGVRVVAGGVLVQADVNRIVLGIAAAAAGRLGRWPGRTP
jgi:hypothetical protein